MFDAVPSDSTGYVFAAYMVFLLLLLIYLGILGAKFQRMNRDLARLTEEVESGPKARPAGRTEPPEEPAQEPTSV